VNAVKRRKGAVTIGPEYFGPVAELRTIGFGLLEYYPPESIQWAHGHQMQMTGLCLRNALNDPEWDDTLVLHVRQLAHTGRLLLDARD
jgi:hypothetical protein